MRLAYSAYADTYIAVCGSRVLGVFRLQLEIQLVEQHIHVLVCQHTYKLLRFNSESALAEVSKSHIQQHEDTCIHQYEDTHTHTSIRGHIHTPARGHTHILVCGHTYTLSAPRMTEVYLTVRTPSRIRSDPACVLVLYACVLMLLNM